jgi:hypothetical protein
MDGIEPRIHYFVGGGDTGIQTKLTNLYATPDPANGKSGAWIVNPENANYEFFYMQTAAAPSRIIASVRINNPEHELDQDFIDPAFQGRKLDDFLLKKRLNHIMTTKTDMYVCYTTRDPLRDMHIRVGMTFTPSVKVDLGGTQYWRLEYNRDPHTLVTYTTFPSPPSARYCSGIALTHTQTELFNYTATHCLQTPGAVPPDVLPNNVRHPGIAPADGIPATSFAMDGANIKWINQVNDINNYMEQTDDVAILKTTVLLDTSNIYILDNVQDLPSRFNINIWTAVGGGWVNGTIAADEDTTFDSVDGILTSNKRFDDTDKYNITRTNFKQFSRKFTAKLPGGSSGGPHGVFFGQGNKKFAIIGNTSSGNWIPNASRQLPWLKTLGVQIKIAHYNADGTVTEYVPTAITSTEVEPVQIPMGSPQRQLNATVLPPQADPSIIWRSSNTRIATVAADGTVTAVAPGSVVISAVSLVNDIRKNIQVNIAVHGGARFNRTRSKRNKRSKLSRRRI